MKLLSFNVHAWQEDNQHEKIAQLAENIANEKYDVIALQEVSQHKDSPYVEGIIREDNYGRVLLAELQKLGVADYSMHWTKAHIGYDVWEEGVAILTPHSVKEVSEIFLTTSKDYTFWKTRKVIRAVVTIEHKNYTFYSGHFGWWNDEEEPFQKQWDTLLNTVNKNEITFVMGDLNNDANVRKEGYDYVLSTGFVDTFSLATSTGNGMTIIGDIAGWEGNKGGRRIDYILVNTPLNVTSSNVVFDGTDTPILSDHAGVKVEIIDSYDDM